MKNRPFSAKLSNKAKLISLAMLLSLSFAGLGVSGVKGTRSKSRAFYGLHGDASNNFDFASSRYGVIAPFAPSPDDSGNIPESLDEMDNHFVYIFDTKKPKSEPIAADLKYCYYPSQSYFDEKRNVVLVRGLEYVEPDGRDAYVGDILVHLGLNLETDSKPYFEDTSVAPIRIENPISGYDGEMPNEFFLGYDKNIIVLTNGEAVITINRSEGYQYPVYFTGSKITYLDYNDSARLLTIGLSKIKQLEDGSCSYSSELRFYELENSGVINLKVRLTEGEFPKAAGILPGTRAVLVSSQVVDNRLLSFRACFPLSDGSLWSVEFTDDSVSGSGDLVKFFLQGFIAELGEDGCNKYPSPRDLVYDSEKRVLTIIKRGPALRIVRPSFIRRPRGIVRPSFIETHSDPVVVVVQFDKKGNFSSYKVFKNEFEGKGGLSNLLIESSLSYIATYDGDLFSLSPGIDSVSYSMNKVGRLGSRVNYIARADEEGAFIGISSFEVDADGHFLGVGSLVIGKPQASF